MSIFFNLYICYLPRLFWGGYWVRNATSSHAGRLVTASFFASPRSAQKQRGFPGTIVIPTGSSLQTPWPLAFQFSMIWRNPSMCGINCVAVLHLLVGMEIWHLHLVKILWRDLPWAFQSLYALDTSCENTLWRLIAMTMYHLQGLVSSTMSTYLRSQHYQNLSIFKLDGAKCSRWTLLSATWFCNGVLHKVSSHCF